MAEKSGSPAAATQEQQQQQQSSQFLSSFIAEIVRSPVNLALVGVIAILVYKIVKSRTRVEEPMPEVKKLPKLRRDFAIEDLTKYDGKGPDGRILVAVNGNVYDVTRGARFYGPGESPSHRIGDQFFHSIALSTAIERCFFFLDSRFRTSSLFLLSSLPRPARLPIALPVFFSIPLLSVSRARFISRFFISLRLARSVPR